MQPEQFYKSVPSVVHPDKGTLLGAKKGGTTDTCNSTVNFKCITQKERSQTQKLYDPFLWNSGKWKTMGTENRSEVTMGWGWRSPSRWGKLRSCLALSLLVLLSQAFSESRSLLPQFQGQHSRPTSLLHSNANTKRAGILALLLTAASSGPREGTQRVSAE